MATAVQVNIPVPPAAVLESGRSGPAGVRVSPVCDRFLQDELVFRADADTAERMDRVVEAVRSSHPEECGSGWRPVAVDPGPWGTCFGASRGARFPGRGRSGPSGADGRRAGPLDLGP